jgi:hypothetical protein
MLIWRHWVALLVFELLSLLANLLTRGPGRIVVFRRISNVELQTRATNHAQLENIWT